MFIDEIKNLKNPFDFDYEKYNKSKGLDSPASSAGQAQSSAE